MAASAPALIDHQSMSVLVQEESSGSNLQPVGDATETVASSAPGIDAKALERDPELSAGLGVESELEPKDLSATVSDAKAMESEVSAEPSGALGASPAGAEPAAGDAHPEESTTVEAPSGPFTIGEFKTGDGATMAFEMGGPVAGASRGAATDLARRDGGAIVFIHGWCGNRTQWQTEMESLVSETTVLSLDLLGHGDSPSEGREEWTIPRYGRDVAGLIEAQNLRDVILIGHAMGGQVALEVALRIPERVVGVIGVESLHQLNVDPAQSANDQSLEDYLKAFQDDFPKAFKDFVESAVHQTAAESIRLRIAADAASCDKDVAIKLMKHFQSRDLKSVVRAIECPVRCINSSLVETDVKGNQALLPGFDVDVMPDVGFWPHVEQPGSFQSRLVLQLKKLRAPKKLAEPPTLTAMRPVLFSDDLEAMASFYTQRLRFEELTRLPQDPEQPATLITLERDGVRLQLQSRASLATDLPGVEGVGSGGQLLFLSVTDLASERMELGTDVDLEIPIRTLPSGSQQTVLRDPDGNVIILQQAAPRRE